MAGPEPYPLAPAWSRAQEEAYAEGRKSAQGSGTKKGQSSRSGSRGKRFVRTAAGERRYGQPIGTEIGNPRNREAAKAQKDTESTKRYSSLVGGDREAQRTEMRKLKDDQLQRLSRVAYSFRSSDPNVVRLRIGVANELARRGFNVNDFGGLGGSPRARGSARSAGPNKAPIFRAAARAAKPKPKVKPARSAMYARRNDRRLREMSVPQLRKALRVFSQIPADKRRPAARVLVNRAVELGVPHFLGKAVVDAAELSAERLTEVIELAGRWKHGWIPLDGAALNEKMKGSTGGKRWWDGGSGKGGAKGRLHSAVGVPKETRSGSGKAWEDKYGKSPVRSSGNAGEDKYGSRGTRVVRNETTGGRYAAKKRESSPDRTSAVKSGPKPKMSPADDAKGAEGRAVRYLQAHGAADTRAKVRKLEAKKVKTSADKANIAALRRALNADSERRFQNQKTRSRLTPEQLAKRGYQGAGSSGKA